MGEAVPLDRQGEIGLRISPTLPKLLPVDKECSAPLRCPPGHRGAKTEPSALHSVLQANPGLASCKAGWSRRGKCGIIVVCLGGTRWSPRLWSPVQGADVQRVGHALRATRGTLAWPPAQRRAYIARSRLY